MCSPSPSACVRCGNPGLRILGRSSATQPQTSVWSHTSLSTQNPRAESASGVSGSAASASETASGVSARNKGPDSETATGDTRLPLGPAA